MANYFFEKGQVVIHKASSEKFVVMDTVGNDIYIFSRNSTMQSVYLPKQIAENVYSLVS